MSYSKCYIPGTYTGSVGLLDEKSCGDQFCFILYFITHMMVCMQNMIKKIDVMLLSSLTAV